MMADLNKQDVHHLVENAKNTILQRILTRQEIQTISDTNRDRVTSYVYDLHQQQLQIMNRSNQQRSQLIRYASALESRIVSLEQDISMLHQLLTKLMEKQPKHITLPSEAVQQHTAPQPQPDVGQPQYVYRGA
jgi:hypothetical protein